MTVPEASEAVVARWLGEAAAVTVLTGAGISTESGIPDFRGARLVVLNAEPTPYDDAAHAVLRAPIGEVLPRLVRAPVGRE